jgi:hypothetical protein
MQLDFTNKDLQTLLTLYNQETEKLKEKLLNGESWENVKPVRRNITELGIAIQKSYGYIVSNKSSNPAEFPQNNESSDQPVE